MKKFRFLKFGIAARVVVSICWILSVFTSCNEEVPELLKKDYAPATLANGKSKVLYIIIDGASGKAMQVISPPNIIGLTPNSLYSWSGLADPASHKMTNPSGWSNLMTGVEASKHKVVNNDFSGNNLSRYPSLLTLLKQSNPGLRTAAFSSSASFSSHFTTGAQVSQTFENDDAGVKSAVVSELNANDPDLVLAQFHGVEIAGSTTNYRDNNPVYRDAILQTDAYIGEIMAALKARPNFISENWMVVITSNKAGEISSTQPNNPTAYDDEARNVFTLFYSPRFSTKFIQKPLATDIRYSGYAVRYTYADNNNHVIATLSDPSLFDLGTIGSYTIQFMIKNTYTNQGGWPTVLSKRDRGFSGPGWNIFLSGRNWKINTSISWELEGTTVSDGTWHVITAVIKRTATENIVKVFTDGKFNAQHINNWVWDNVSNGAPLRIGRIAGNDNNTPDLLISNLQIYNTALENSDVAALSCLPRIDSSHPFYANLIGYWPGDEAAGAIIKEKTGKYANANFQLAGPYSWRDFNEVSPNVCPPSPASYFRLVPNSIDVPFQIFQWMGIQPDVEWSLDGRGWPPVYSIIKP